MLKRAALGVVGGGEIVGKEHRNQSRVRCALDVVLATQRVQAGAGSRGGPAEEEWFSVHALLVRLAADTIDTHTNHGGLCACCVEPWPCALAQRAEFLLGAL